MTATANLDGRIAEAQECLDEAAVIATAQELVRIPSVYDPARPDANESAAASFVAGMLDTWGVGYTCREVAPGRPNLVADLRGTRPGPVLIFEGHTDVVTAGDPRAWSLDPFGAEIRDGRLYGRGSCDMKGGLAAMLHAARALQLSGCNFAGTLRLAVLADEEGLMLGAKGFVADGYLDGATAAISCEPESNAVCVAQKGAIRLRVELTGKMAHGCMPEEGANPVVALGEVLVALRELERGIQLETVRHPLLGTFSLTPTVTLAGEPAQGNVIPGSALLLLDIRTTPANGHAEIHQRVRRTVTEAVTSVAGVSVIVDTLDDRPWTETDSADPVVEAVMSAHEAIFGVEPRYGGVPGTTDGTIFWAASRIPFVAHGPGTVTLAHQVDEFVEVADIVRYARLYIDAALRYFHVMEGRGR